MDNRSRLTKRNIASSNQKSGSPPANGSCSEINELLASVSDVNRRLQNVSTVNKKLRQQKQDMTKELNVQKEQLSTLFQENCGLQEKAARLDMENKTLRKEKLQLIEENHHLLFKLQDFELRHSDCLLSKPLSSDPSVGMRNSAPAGIPAVEKIRVLEKRHSSPQFYPCKESRSDSRESLPTSRDITMDLQRQMIERQRPTSSQPDSILPSDYSLLSIVVPEEQMLEDVNNCLENMTSIKRDADIVNHNLKYLVHACFSAKLNAPSKGLHQDNYKPVLIGRGGDGPSGDEKHSGLEFASSNSETRTCVDSLENFSPDNTGRMSYLAEDLGKIRLDGIKSQYDVPRVQLIAPDFRYEQQNIQAESTPGLFHQRHWGASTYLDPLECETKSVILRSDSSEVVASSPPPSSSLLTPDSLASSGHQYWAAQRGNDQHQKKEFSGMAASNSPDDDERKCPVCYAVFPETVLQKDFEAHVLRHWDLEEYELINAQ